MGPDDCCTRRCLRVVFAVHCCIFVTLCKTLLFLALFSCLCHTLLRKETLLLYRSSSDSLVVELEVRRELYDLHRRYPSGPIRYLAGGKYIVPSPAFGVACTN